MLVFVYGTLKKNGSNQHVMRNAGGIYRGEAETYGEYNMYNLGGFPAAVVGGKTPIKGELYEVSDIRPLDWLEGHPDFYKRREVKVIKWPCEILTCWMYELNDTSEFLQHSSLIEDGYWKVS